MLHAVISKTRAIFIVFLMGWFFLYVTFNRQVAPVAHSELLEAKEQRHYNISLNPEHDATRASRVSVTKNSPGAQAESAVNTTLTERIDNTILFHVGKGGGGTVTSILSKHHIRSVQCHPHPSKCSNVILRNGPETIQNVVINIRDPVDRFVSAFDWRVMVLCQKGKNETRTRTSEGVAQRASKFCRESKIVEVERAILHDTYQHNVNEMAESLCFEGHKGDLARENVRLVEHMKSTLSDWLQLFASEPSTSEAFSSVQQIMAVVVEPGQDIPFEQTISNAANVLVHKQYPDLVTEFMKPPQINSTPKKVIHSSSEYFPGRLSSTKLSTMGECCIARHHSKDYQMLRVLAGLSDPESVDPRVVKACQWGSESDSKNCVDSLRSMIARQEPYLKDMSVSCQDIVGATH